MPQPSRSKPKPASSKTRATLKHVADHAGVSVSTVSDILNRGLAEQYTQDMQDRVRASMRALGYRPAREAQNLRRGWSNNAGVILTHGFENPYYARLHSALKQALETLHLVADVVVIDQRDAASFTAAMDRLVSHGVSGLIVGPLYYWDDSLIDAVQSRSAHDIPVVCFGSVCDLAGVEAIVLPDRAGGETAARSLIALGHRRIGFLGAYGAADAPRGRGTMQEGFEAGLLEAGVTDRGWFVPSPDSGRYDTGFDDAAALAQRWLAASPNTRPTAILCKNDQLAIACVAAFAKHGVRVPDDVSVMGYDNVPESAYTVPALTTIDGAMHQRTAEIARRLAHRMGGGVDGPGDPDPAAVPAPEVILRDSLARLTPAQRG
ncbi:MAG: LacI family DNA-binding transcriptional regulator [Planctomycetota bacterium]